MNKIALLLTVCAISHASMAAWYWPFGDDENEEKRPRISELMEPASLLIDEASDFVESGKISEAVDAYKRALAELDRIELENAERAQSTEFATLRNKRAYVNAAIDSLHLKQAQENARAVAVTDTTELEKKYARRKKGGALSDEKKMEIAEEKIADHEEQKIVAVTPPAKPAAPVVQQKPVAQQKPSVQPATPAATTVRDEIKRLLAQDPKSRRGRLMLAAEDLKAKDFAAALLTIDGLLEERPNDSAALNLRAAIESEKGDYKKAERTLDQSIQSNPRSHYAYYNMARLFIQTRGGEGKASAKRYYDAGRSVGGPVDAGLEAALK